MTAYIFLCEQFICTGLIHLRTECIVAFIVSPRVPLYLWVAQTVPGPIDVPVHPDITVWKSVLLV